MYAEAMMNNTAAANTAPDFDPAAMEAYRLAAAEVRETVPALAEIFDNCAAIGAPVVMAADRLRDLGMAREAGRLEALAGF